MQIAFNAYVSFSFCVLGIFLVYALAVKSLKEGRAKTRYGEYYRKFQPVSFWSVVIGAIIVGLIACWMAIFIWLHPIKI